ncbi:neutral/alkaline non-lysosomal ceramidase N-terminal domain-containing protein [Halosimplex amylolyticum]|uniref:neutral/alkaline non-lysosomal ceramidase N-terminal domain-containing protein n=1 Tax=Halosimplex amylolyticum TaxID=3396616 RepID=UPI003F54E5D4
MPDRDAGSGDGRPGEWCAGVATTTITPDESLWLAGYADRTEPADGAETDLHAKALAVSDADGATVVLVSVEIISIPPALRRTLLDRCADQFGLGPESLAFTATHTHCGPIVQSFRGRMYGLGDDGVDAALAYRDRLADHLVDVVGAALADRDPATLSYGHARCGFAMNRRRPTPDGIANAAYPDGPVDHDVPVLAVESEGRLEAVAFGYACHATTLRLDRYCGDWPGFAMAAVEDRYGGATALFLTGCAGDQNPYPKRRLDVARDHGRSLANAVEAALEASRRPVHGPLRLARETVPVAFEGYDGRAELERLRASADPYERRHARLLLDRLGEDGDLRETYPYPMRAVGFGTDLTLLALAGEPLVEYALRFEARLPGPLWVAGYTNGSFTYVPTRRALAEGGYEGGSVTRFRRYPGRVEPSVERRVLSTGEALARRVGGTRG